MEVGHIPLKNVKPIFPLSNGTIYLNCMIFMVHELDTPLAYSLFEVVFQYLEGVITLENKQEKSMNSNAPPPHFKIT